MGGVDKTPILEAFRPHIYFDDQKAHCEPASKLVPTAHVPGGPVSEEDDSRRVEDTAMVATMEITETTSGTTE
jgi:5'-nucleotidase